MANDDLMVTIGGMRYRREDAIARKMITKDGKLTDAGQDASKEHAAVEKRRAAVLNKGRTARNTGGTAARNKAQTDTKADTKAKAEAEAKAEEHAGGSGS